MQLQRLIITLAPMRRTPCMDTLPVLHGERSVCAQVDAILLFCYTDRHRNMSM